MAVEELPLLTTFRSLVFAEIFFLDSPFSMLTNGLFIRDHSLGRWPLVPTRGHTLRCDWLVPYLKSFFEDSKFSRLYAQKIIDLRSLVSELENHIYTRQT